MKKERLIAVIRDVCRSLNVKCFFCGDKCQLGPVGDIDDESSVRSIGDVRIIDEFNYYVSGGLLIDEFNDYFDEDIESEEVDTIAGYIIHHIGYVPDKDERVSVRVNDYVLTTSEIQNGRIYSVLLNIDDERMIEVDYVVMDNFVHETEINTQSDKDEKSETKDK